MGCSRLGEAELCSVTRHYSHTRSANRCRERITNAVRVNGRITLGPDQRPARCSQKGGLMFCACCRCLMKLRCKNRTFQQRLATVTPRQQCWRYKYTQGLCTASLMLVSHMPRHAAIAYDDMAVQMMLPDSMPPFCGSAHVWVTPLMLGDGAICCQQSLLRAHL